MKLSQEKNKDDVVIVSAARTPFGRFGAALKDVPGFVTTRMLNAFLAEAYRVVEEGVSTPADVDKAAKLAFNHPMGPLELADFSGLDTAYRTAKALEAAYGERYRPTHTMHNLVLAGHLGRKTKRGWHRYE